MNPTLENPFIYTTVYFPGDITIELAEVKGGAFQMGGDNFEKAQPIHCVEVSDFEMGKTPITNHQFAAFMNVYGSAEVKHGKNAGKLIIQEYERGIHKVGNEWFPSKGFKLHPIIGVTWYGAVEFCCWLTENSNGHYYLPSESEWEFAARGGQKKHNFKFAGSSKLKEVGWFKKNNHHETKPVGLKLPNALGLYEMSGNVWEWCSDHWHEYYIGAPCDGSSWTTYGDLYRRVVRGGSWYYGDSLCFVSIRGMNEADNSGDGIGFRVVRR